MKEWGRAAFMSDSKMVVNTDKSIPATVKVIVPPDGMQIVMTELESYMNFGGICLEIGLEDILRCLFRRHGGGGYNCYTHVREKPKTKVKTKVIRITKKSKPRPSLKKRKISLAAAPQEKPKEPVKLSNTATSRVSQLRSTLRNRSSVDVKKLVTDANTSAIVQPSGEAPPKKMTAEEMGISFGDIPHHVFQRYGEINEFMDSHRSKGAYSAEDH